MLASLGAGMYSSEKPMVPLKTAGASKMNIDENNRQIDGAIQTVYSKKSRETEMAADNDKNIDGPGGSSLFGVRKMKEELK